MFDLAWERFDKLAVLFSSEEESHRWYLQVFGLRVREILAAE